jgi:hypothetical protein
MGGKSQTHYSEDWPEVKELYGTDRHWIGDTVNAIYFKLRWNFPPRSCVALLAVVINAKPPI